MSMEEQCSAEQKFNSVLCGEGDHVSKLLDAYLQDRERLEYDDWDLETYKHYLKIYDYESLNIFVDDFRIKNNEARWQMALAILKAAYEYDTWKERQLRKPKSKEYKASMKKLRTGLTKALSELSPDVDIEDKEYSYHRYYMEALKDKITELFENKSTIYTTSQQLQHMYSAEHISSIDIGYLFEVMTIVAEEQIVSPPFKTKKHEDAIYTWIAHIVSAWDSYSDLPIKVGKHYKEIGIVSYQVKMLEDIMRPLNPNITNAQISNALRTYLEENPDREMKAKYFL